MQLRDLLARVMLSAAPLTERSMSPIHARSSGAVLHDRAAPLSAQSLDHDLVALLPGTSFNPAPGLSVLATGSATCDPGWTTCGTGCMPIGSVCCSGKGFCEAGEYCTGDDACCPVRMPLSLGWGGTDN
jgi:hypothetical protein